MHWIDWTRFTGFIELDWSDFIPPTLSSVVDYRVSRCIGEGIEGNCIVLNDGIIENTYFTDEFDYDEDDVIKYIISVNYENNPYWGWANSELLNPFGCGDLGDMNGDAGWNVLDIVALANCVLAGNCGNIENGVTG